MNKLYELFNQYNENFNINVLYGLYFKHESEDIIKNDIHIYITAKRNVSVNNKRFKRCIYYNLLTDKFEIIQSRLYNLRSDYLFEDIIEVKQNKQYSYIIDDNYYSPTNLTKLFNNKQFINSLNYLRTINFTNFIQEITNINSLYINELFLSKQLFTNKYKPNITYEQLIKKINYNDLFILCEIDMNINSIAVNDINTQLKNIIDNNNYLYINNNSNTNLTYSFYFLINIKEYANLMKAAIIYKIINHL